ncbi:hypothetical protein SAMN04515667_2309 [Formosa sp. Hel1_31_208]|uniref:hypothetical protein n=1 Tax=Formosa sp. Hel1_31_208 TaxID=1798225 RepID=UPI00087995D9|nr:hypothetical protein [Formosa sp. Hel1_31_208]SDS49771.1 hypothetical protein SAMN04515667_2309 [Formosa sp. Hel1_31_208]
MPKPYTFPIIYDEVLQISITKLKEWGYLNSQRFRSNIITWSTNGEKTSSILIKLITRGEQSYIELDYKFGNEARKYKVGLVSVPSNLGKGVIWYFLCPQTNRKCRKLYSISGYFLHREAFGGCMYESQTQSKQWRYFKSVYGTLFDLERCYDKLYSKHFKTHYRGKPTKRYLRLLRQINNLEHQNIL